VSARAAERVFRLPDLGEGLTEAEILEWRIAVGDTVTVDQNVVAVETAKAAVDVPCPIAGTIARLYGEPGGVVKVGEPLIAVSVADERYREEERAGSGNVLVGYGTVEGRRSRRRAARAAQSAPPAAPAVSVVAAAPAASADGEVPRVISPVVRRLARTYGIDLVALPPSGPGGVILRRDVEAAMVAGNATAADTASADTASARTSAADAVPPPGTGTGPDAVAPHDDHAGDLQPEVRVPIQGVRRTIAEKLSRSRREIPDATTWVDVDATPLVELKADINKVLPDAGIGMLALLARICVAGLRRYPELNATVDTERAEIVRLPRVHLGFACQTDRGLVVPVVRDAHRLTLAALAARLRERTEAARAGRLAPRDLTGGTFTLNNYGVFGVDGSTPIINHPEAAMLGVGRITDRPWAYEGEVRLRKVAQLSFTFDHRICDGGVAGGFLRFVADCVERPAVLVSNS
jgi:pyruvate/2-oxoglutarate dehydrogenase complex dihydrolipoamide acyltransferase (E2) component